MAALAATLSQENPRLRTREIDIDESPASASSISGLSASSSSARYQAEAVLAAATAEYQGPVAERAGQTWIRRYLRHPLPKTDSAFKTGDRVLITGGLGDVGLTLARHLATGYGCRLILCTRSTLPPRSAWQDFLAEVPAGQRAGRRVQNILALEAAAPVMHDGGRRRSGRDEGRGRRRGGALRRDRRRGHGAACRTRASSPSRTSPSAEQSEAHLDAKVRGFLVLDRVLAGHCPDRRITLSSLSAVLGGADSGGVCRLQRRAGRVRPRGAHGRDRALGHRELGHLEHRRRAARRPRPDRHGLHHGAGRGRRRLRARAGRLGPDRRTW